MIVNIKMILCDHFHAKGADSSLTERLQEILGSSGVPQLEEDTGMRSDIRTPYYALWVAYAEISRQAAAGKVDRVFAVGPLPEEMEGCRANLRNMGPEQRGRLFGVVMAIGVDYLDGERVVLTDKIKLLGYLRKVA